MASQTQREEIVQAISALCQSCGFCCNGVLFSRVTLMDDDPLLTKVEMKYYSLSYLPASDFMTVTDSFGSHADEEAPRSLDHPCMFLKKGSCKEYRRRPARCREYECILVWQVANGKIPVEWAKGIMMEALLLYGRLCDRLQKVDLSRGFWINARRLASQPDFAEPGVYGKLGIDSDTVPLMQEFAAFLDEHFHPTPPAKTGSS